MNTNWLKFVAYATVAFFLSVRIAFGQEVWLAPAASIAPSSLARTEDFGQLFMPDAPWKNAAKKTNVFKFYGAYLGAVPQDELNRVIGDLNRRHIPIALEVGILDVTPVPFPSCGGLGLVEGYTSHRSTENIIKKIKQAGGALRYIAMDEPIWYGHYYDGVPGKQLGCRSPLPELIGQLAGIIALYRREFPGIEIGLIEPSLLMAKPDSVEVLQTFAALFCERTGEPLRFLHIDVPWGHPQGLTSLPGLFNFAKSNRNLFGAVGVIYNGTSNDSTDATWMASARKHIDFVERMLHLRPDHVIFQSWDKYPTHSMPENDPNVLTNLVLNYRPGDAPRSD